MLAHILHTVLEVLLFLQRHFIGTYFLAGMVHQMVATHCHQSFDCCVSPLDTSSSVEVLDWHLFSFDLPLLQNQKAKRAVYTSSRVRMSPAVLTHFLNFNTQQSLPHSYPATKVLDSAQLAFLVLLLTKSSCVCYSSTQHFIMLPKYHRKEDCGASQVCAPFCCQLTIMLALIIEANRECETGWGRETGMSREAVQMVATGRLGAHRDLVYKHCSVILLKS